MGSKFVIFNINYNQCYWFMELATLKLAVLILTSSFILSLRALIERELQASIITLVELRLLHLKLNFDHEKSEWERKDHHLWNSDWHSRSLICRLCVLKLRLSSPKPKLMDLKARSCPPVPRSRTLKPIS